MSGERFDCPTCGKPLATVETYVSGSNQYWVLRCDEHGRFTASSYVYKESNGWVPQPWPETAP